MGAVFSMCPHLFLYPVFCILAGNLLALGHNKRVWIVARHSIPTLASNSLIINYSLLFSLQNYEFFSYKINFFRKIIT